MSWFDDLARGLGTANAPFGFAPVGSPSQGPVDPAYNAGMGMLGDMGMRMLASGSRNPAQAFGQAYLGAQEQAQLNNRNQAVAAEMMQAAADKRQEREQEQQKQKWLDEQIAALPPKLRGIARIMPEKVFGAQIDAMFSPPSASNQPAAIQEYEYARNQGFKGTFQDWEASKKGGMALTVDPATGQVTFQQGANMKPMTEGQSKDTTFATRAEGALKVFEPLATSMTSLYDAVAGKVPLVGNYAKSPQYQQAEQSGREFLAAILRKDTGAAITPSEVTEYGTVYLPAPGDSPQVLAQKSASRRRAVEALKAGMTPQAILAQETALKNTNGPVPIPPPNSAGQRYKYNPVTGELE